MALDSTARESNVRDSLKKYFIDSFFTAEQVRLTFDKGLAAPSIQGTAVTRWIAVQFGSLVMDTMSEHVIQIFCCTREDPEGYRLAQLRDKVLGYLTDADATDGLKRIPFYKSNVNPWELIGGLVVLLDPESPQLVADDETKFKIIPFRIKWGAKI